MKGATLQCEAVREMMPDLAAGLCETTPQMEEHFQSCGDCAAKLEEFRQTMALLDEWQVPEPSPYFDTRLNARLREESERQPVGWFARLRRPALALSFAVLMIASVSLVQFRGSGVAKTTTTASVMVEPGSAVSDLQALDSDQSMYSDFDVLDDLQVQQDVTATP